MHSAALSASFYVTKMSNVSIPCVVITGALSSVFEGFKTVITDKNTVT